MPDTITGPEELLARILSLAQMKRENGTGMCGEPPDMCFDVFANGIGISRTHEAVVDQALQTMRDTLVSTWTTQAGLVQQAAHQALGGEWKVEFTSDQTRPELIQVRPTD